MNSDRMSMRHTLAAHALTAGVTLLAMAILFGGRLGLIRQPPAVQIRRCEKSFPHRTRIHAGGSDS